MQLVLCERLELDRNEIVQVQSERECQVARDVFQRLFHYYACRQVSQFDRVENRRTRAHHNHKFGNVYQFDRALGHRVQTYRNSTINRLISRRFALKISYNFKENKRIKKLSKSQEALLVFEQTDQDWESWNAQFGSVVVKRQQNKRDRGKFSFEANYSLKFKNF